MTPGVYADSDREDYTGAIGAERLFRARSIAVATATMPQRFPLSHTSAAVVHALPLLHPPLRHVHLTSGTQRGGGIRSGRHLHATALSADDIVEVGGVHVTALDRTAADVATMGSFAQALTVIDGALRAGADDALMVRHFDLARPGIRPARRALAAASSRSESVGESWSRAQVIEAGLPVPTLQREVRGRSGRTYRCDFCWGEKLVGEFDGIVKYGRLLRVGEDAADAVIREKAREDDLRAAGLMVVRWTWKTLCGGGLSELLIPWLRHYNLV